MAMELKITSPSPEGFVKEIIWNADEIAAEIEQKVGYYKTLVYTDEQVVEAKKDRATLNKFVAALKAKDREIKDLCLAPYDEFHRRMLQIIAKVEEPAALIDKQVKEFEEDQKKKKREKIEEVFTAHGFQPWVTLEKIWNPKWLNKTYTVKQIDDDMNRKMYKIGEDIFLINKQGAGVQAALAEYKRSLDVVKAVNAATRFVEAQKAEQAAAEAARASAQVIGMEAADEQLPGQTNIADYLAAQEQEPAPAPTPTPSEPIMQQISESVPFRKEIFFKVYVSREELAALNNYLKSSGITFRQVRDHK